MTVVTPTCSSQHNLLKGWSIVCHCNDAALQKNIPVLVFIQHAFTTMQYNFHRPSFFLGILCTQELYGAPNIWEVYYMDYRQTSGVHWQSCSLFKNKDGKNCCELDWFTRGLYIPAPVNCTPVCHDWLHPPSIITEETPSSITAIHQITVLAINYSEEELHITC